MAEQSLKDKTIKGVTWKGIDIDVRFYYNKQFLQ